MFEGKISICIEKVSPGENSWFIMFYKSFILYDEVLKNYVLIYYTLYLLIHNVLGNFTSNLQNLIFCYVSTLSVIEIKLQQFMNDNS